MIKKMYEKSEIWFTVAWIIVYCVLASVGDDLSKDIGIEKSITLPILLILSIVLILFVSKNGLLEKYGLCKSHVKASKMLFYVPIFILFAVNVWYGIYVNLSPLETVFYILTMFCVGFLEEMIFRGFLFCAMAKDGVKSAIIVSSVTFGIGHIVNIFNGSGMELFDNILQVIHAITIGFMLVMIFYKTKSIIMCIVMHCGFNALSVFVNTPVLTPEKRIISNIFTVVVSLGYGLYIYLKIKNEEEA